MWRWPPLPVPACPQGAQLQAALRTRSSNTMWIDAIPQPTARQGCIPALKTSLYRAHQTSCFDGVYAVCSSAPLPSLPPPPNPGDVAIGGSAVSPTDDGQLRSQRKQDQGTARGQHYSCIPRVCQAHEEEPGVTDHVAPNNVGAGEPCHRTPLPPTCPWYRSSRPTTWPGSI